ncbi:uncharacterized protein DMENIID0001_069520 [Sergentomyia squamirostris]
MTIPKVIFDTDGGVDDAWALLMLLKAHSLKIIELLAIITCSGNTDIDYSTINTCRVLEVTGVTNVPVFRGAPETMGFLENPERDNFFGLDGFGDVFPPDALPDMSFVNLKEHGVEVLARLIKQYPHEVTYIAVGPPTNLGFALRLSPEIADLIHQVFLMGGNFLGIGNITPYAEFNTFYDPEATDIVLRMLKCPIVVIPWETTIPPLNFVNRDWSINLSEIENSNPILDFINPIEEALFKKWPDILYWTCADPLTVAVFLAKDLLIISSEDVYASVELQSSDTRGQWLLDHENHKPNVKIITHMDTEVFKKCLLWTVDIKSQHLELLEYLQIDSDSKVCRRRK